jgi:hypothetical protein
MPHPACARVSPVDVPVHGVPPFREREGLSQPVLSFFHDGARRIAATIGRGILMPAVMYGALVPVDQLAQELREIGGRQVPVAVDRERRLIHGDPLRLRGPPPPRPAGEHPPDDQPQIEAEPPASAISASRSSSSRATE